MDNNYFAPHPVDNSAFLHLAVHSRTHSNVFRLEVHLRSAVRPARLQQAADAVAARCPMLAAGIRRQGGTFWVVPCPGALFIRVDRQPLAYMPAEELRDCAVRVLYGQHRIAVEFFHALTDGTGGLYFLQALLAEYFDVPTEPQPGREAWEDSYKKYAAGKPTALPGGRSFLFPAAPEEPGGLCRTTLIFSARALRAKAREENTSLTAWFTALFAQTAMQLQQAEAPQGLPQLPVQVMVPIDLRRRFPSASLRNFSLYALPRLTPEAAGAPFPELVESMTAQLRAQSAFAPLQAAITTNVALEQRTASLPLGLKCAALRAGFGVCGGHSSCITVSNLGPVTFPAGVQDEVRQLDFLLTPRVHSPYNCGIVSVGDTLSLTITRRGKDRGVEKAFIAALARRGCVPEPPAGPSSGRQG